MLSWLGDLTHSKIAALLVFFPLFVAIVIYVYGSRNRSKRLESYKFIPLQDDDDEQGKGV